MILVFFCTIFFICILILLMIILSKIEITINKLYVDSENKTEDNKDLTVEVSLKIFGMKWIKIKANKDKIINMYKKMQSNQKDKKNKEKVRYNQINIKKVIKEIKKVKVKLSMLNLDIKIGTDDCILTSYLVAAIATIISNILPYAFIQKSNIQNYKYRISPIYQNKSLYNIKLNCIINAKLVHIIYVIYLIKKGRSDKNERTSNRKSYDYSYE